MIVIQVRLSSAKCLGRLLFLRILTIRLQEKLNRAGAMPETLVPIRLDIEAGGMTLSDAFTWNLHGKATL